MAVRLPPPLIVAPLLLAAAGCDADGSHGDARGRSPSLASSSFDPAFLDFSGAWRPVSGDAHGRVMLMRIDSGGTFVVDLVDGRGRVSAVRGSVSVVDGVAVGAPVSPPSREHLLRGWRARLVDPTVGASQRRLSLKGAGGWEMVMAPAG